MNIPVNTFHIKSWRLSEPNAFITVRPDVINGYINNGQWISLIKQVREVSGLGLKEAKDIVDSCKISTNEVGGGGIDREKMWEAILKFPNVQESLKPANPYDALKLELKKHLEYALTLNPDPIEDLTHILKIYKKEFKKLNDGVLTIDPVNPVDPT